MKSYQKPSLEIVAFEMNEAIASCSDSIPDDLKAWYDQLGINFTADSSCTVPTYDYCYYTSTSEGTTGILVSS